jgi:hypothetical protein
LFDYLARHPEAQVTVQSAGERRTLSGADGVALPFWKARFGLFRSVATAHPPQCQLHWLPAY